MVTVVDVGSVEAACVVVVVGSVVLEVEGPLGG